MNNTNLNNYIEVLEKENKEFKKQINDLRVENSNLGFINVMTTSTMILLMVIFICVIFYGKNKKDN